MKTDTKSQVTATTPKEEHDQPHPHPQTSSGIGRVGDLLGKSIVTVVKHTTPDAVKDVWRLARWETQNIRCWRTLIFFLLLITGAFVSTYMYVFLRREQDSDFEANVSTMFPSCSQGVLVKMPQFLTKIHSFSTV
jgi:hypothetical protein